jgi:hypothetical protein
VFVFAHRIVVCFRQDLEQDRAVVHLEVEDSDTEELLFSGAILFI